MGRARESAPDTKALFWFWPLPKRIVQHLFFPANKSSDCFFFYQQINCKNTTRHFAGVWIFYDNLNNQLPHYISKKKIIVTFLLCPPPRLVIVTQSIYRWRKKKKNAYDSSQQIPPFFFIWKIFCNCALWRVYYNNRCIASADKIRLKRVRLFFAPFDKHTSKKNPFCFFFFWVKLKDKQCNMSLETWESKEKGFFFIIYFISINFYIFIKNVSQHDFDVGYVRTNDDKSFMSTNIGYEMLFTCCVYVFDVPILPPQIFL